MNIVVDRETRIAGLGLTQEEAMNSMNFYVERSGKLSPARELRRKEIHAWLPSHDLLHVKGVGAIQYKDNCFVNLRTGRTVRVAIKPLSHYLCLYNAFDGKLSFEDFTLTLAQEVNAFLEGISKTFLTLNDFPYIKPVETLSIKHYHATVIPELSVVETTNDTIVIIDGGVAKEVDKTAGISSDCLLAYLFASMGYLYDGRSLRRTNED